MWRFFLFALLCLSFTAAARAQTASSPTPSIFNREEEKPVDQSLAEATARNAIKREEAAHAENIERARELAKLGAQLRDAFQNAKTLTTGDLKKLERMEKLARKIRNVAGGSGDADVDEADLPKSTEQAVARLAKLSDELRASVEKTPRQVVSAAIIEHTNELLELIERLRKSSK